MTRRRWLGLGVAAGLLLSGCGAGKRSLRTASEPETLPPYDIDAMRTGEGIELPPDDPKAFFPSGTKTGTWSSQAREIERSLGVEP
jgi:hypothetical protein